MRCKLYFFILCLTQVGRSVIHTYHCRGGGARGEGEGLGGRGAQTMV